MNRFRRLLIRWEEKKKNYVRDAIRLLVDHLDSGSDIVRTS